MPPADDASWLLSHRRWWATAAPARRLAVAELAHTRAYVAGTLSPADEDALIAHAAAARAALSLPEQAEALERSARYKAVMREGGPGMAQRVLALQGELTRPLLLDGWEDIPDGHARYTAEGSAHIFAVGGAYSLTLLSPVRHSFGQMSRLEWAIVAAEGWLVGVQESAPSTDREQGPEVDGG